MGIKLKHCFLILIYLYSKNPACQLMRLSDYIFCFDLFHFFHLYFSLLSFVLFRSSFFRQCPAFSSYPVFFLFFVCPNRSQSVAVQYILFAWIFRYFNISTFLHFGESIAAFYFCFLYFLDPVFFPCFFCLFVTSIS